MLEALAARVLDAYQPALRRLLDGLALLDMLACFARYAARGGEGGGPQFARPTLTEVCRARHGCSRGAVGQAACRQLVHTPLAPPPPPPPARPPALVEARHPVLEALEGGCTPNDTYLSFASSLHIITG